MKFTRDWLFSHLETDRPLADILDVLPMLGLEVESIVDRAAALAPFVIAEVITAEQHPNADKLRVCMVNIGAGDPVQVVCGAPNARAGMKGVFAPVGAYVPGIDLTLKTGEIRGELSNGMLCSEREMQLSDEHDGIIDLAADAPVGASFAVHAGLDDPIIEIAITFLLMYSIHVLVRREVSLFKLAFGVGLMVSVLSFCFGGLTGASMNPARTFGPNIATESGHLILYSIATVIGAVLSNFIPEPLDEEP